MYQRLEGAGVSTASLNFICHNTDIGESVFFDTMGTPSRVKATLSDFLDHGKIGCESEDGYGWHGRWNLHYMMKIQKLPAGKTPQITDTWVHGFVMLKIFGTEIDHEHLEDWFPSPGAARFGLLLKNGQDVEMEFYLRLRRFVEKTPLAAEWRNWLFKLFTKERWIHECRTCFGEYRAWIVAFEEKKLQDAISGAIRQRQSEVVAIFGEDGMKPIQAEPQVLDVHQEAYINYGRIDLTQGVYAEAEEKGAFWFLDVIASYQMYPEFKSEPFQVWELKQIGDTRTFLVTCHNGNGMSLFAKKFGDVMLDGDNVIPRVRLLTRVQTECDPVAMQILRTEAMKQDYRLGQLIPYSDFPDSEWKVYNDMGVVLLPEEY